MLFYYQCVTAVSKAGNIIMWKRHTLVIHLDEPIGQDVGIQEGGLIHLK